MLHSTLQLLCKAISCQTRCSLRISYRYSMICQLFFHLNKKWNICADKGAQYVLDAGLMPDWILGDLDSLDADALVFCRNVGIDIITLPTHKNDTDTEALLHCAIDNGYDDLLLLGATGGRIDHLLANLALMLAARKRSAKLRILDAAHDIRLLDDVDVIEGAVGQTFSLLPLGGDARAHAVAGVEYPLDHLILPMSSAIGVSNVLTAPRAEIRVEQGIIVLIRISHRTTASSGGLIGPIRA